MSKTNPLFLSEQALAARWAISPKTLQNHRYEGKPLAPYTKLGGLIRYKIAEVEKAETCAA